MPDQQCWAAVAEGCCPSLIRAGAVPSPKVNWFSADPRSYLQLAEKKGPPFDQKHQGRRQWRSPCDLHVPTTVLVWLRVDGWQSLAGPIVQCDPACSYWMPRHSLPAPSDRCLTGDGKQQWWRSYVLVRSDRAPDRRRKASWFPAIRRSWLATKEFRPLFQSIKQVDTVMASPQFQACLSAQHHEHRQQCFCESKAACTKFSSSSVASIQHISIERTTFKKKKKQIIWRSCHKTKNHETQQSAEPPDSHIPTTAKDQKPHVHSLILGAMSSLPDNQSPSNRWHFTRGTTRLHSCSAVKSLYFSRGT